MNDILCFTLSIRMLLQAFTILLRHHCSTSERPTFCTIGKRFGTVGLFVSWAHCPDGRRIKAGPVPPAHVCPLMVVSLQIETHVRCLWLTNLPLKWWSPFPF
jgi:hypothetical protein